MTDDAMKSLRNKVIALGIDKVFIGDPPSLELECVSIRPIDGYPSTRYFGDTDCEEPLIEVLVRAKTYSLGQRWYNIVSNGLDRFSDLNVKILSCLLTGSPGYLGADTNGFGEWHMLFHVTLQE